MRRWRGRRPGSCGKLIDMSDPARKLLHEALALSENERLELASDLIASVDGPADAGWDAAWLAELDERVEIAREAGHTGADWVDVRARILGRLGRT